LATCTSLQTKEIKTYKKDTQNARMKQSDAGLNPRKEEIEEEEE
jgi:hypothetical protein